jgi:nuclease HARBI1
VTYYYSDNRKIDELSRLCLYAIHHLYDQFHHLLDTFDHARLTPSQLKIFAAAITSRGCPLQNTWGFIDGTIRPVARPSKYQRQAYNGHKRVHALKFQSVVTPDGIISHLTGPWVGRRHDARMLRESGLYEQLETYANCDGHPMHLYGDPAYPLTSYILSPYKGSQVNNDEAEFNRRMSSVRECVEWGFGKIVSLFAFVDFKKNQKIFLQPIGRMYVVAALLTNCHTCIYGSQTSMFFNCPPPTLENYLHD